MTRDEVLAMEAGREFDKLMAAEVMGIKKLHYSDYDSDKEFPYYIPSGKPWRTHQIDAKPLPRFSGDISDAWPVLERLIERGLTEDFFNTLQAVVGITGRPAWEHLRIIGIVISSGKFPEAICHAALLTMKEE